MGQQILVIDDTKRVHPLVKAILADEPVDVHSAYDGEYGLTLAASLKPDLILLDVDMPGINGYEVCRQLKSSRDLFNTPVIFLTAKSTPKEKVDGLELGAVDYVTKPFHPSELLARVRATLRTSRLIKLLDDHALVDYLTGLGNKAMFKQRLAAEVSLRVRSGKPLACVLVDVDEFDALNKNHGRPFGDRVLHEIAKIITSVCRIEDVACRLEADVFAIITPNTETEKACELGKRMLAGLAQLQVNSRGIAIPIKCSVAVSPSIAVYDSAMLDRASEAIDRSRQQGSTDLAIADAPPNAKAAAA